MSGTSTLTDLEFRAAGPDDEPALSELFLAARPALGLTGLDAAGVDALVQLQRRAQRQSYAAAWPSHRTEVICRAGLVIGLIIVGEDAESVHVLDVAVLPSARGAGVGTAALMRMIEATDKPVELMVAIGNSAQRLYARLGFVEVGRNDIDVMLRRLPGAG